MGIGKRLRKAILSKNSTLKEFSQKSKIPYITLQQYVADNQKPGANALIEISKCLNISIDWLLIGQGNMYNPPQDSPPLPTRSPVQTIEEIDETLKDLFGFRRKGRSFVTDA